MYTRDSCKSTWFHIIITNVSLLVTISNVYFYFLLMLSIKEKPEPNQYATFATREPIMSQITLVSPITDMKKKDDKSRICHAQHDGEAPPSSHRTITERSKLNHRGLCLPPPDNYPPTRRVKRGTG